MIQATHKNTILDYGLRGITFFGVSMPNFLGGTVIDVILLRPAQMAAGCLFRRRF